MATATTRQADASPPGVPRLAAHATPATAPIWRSVEALPECPPRRSAGAANIAALAIVGIDAIGPVVIASAKDLTEALSREASASVSLTAGDAPDLIVIRRRGPGAGGHDQQLAHRGLRGCGTVAQADRRRDHSRAAVSADHGPAVTRGFHLMTAASSGESQGRGERRNSPRLQVDGNGATNS